MQQIHIRNTPLLLVQAVGKSAGRLSLLLGAALEVETLHRRRVAALMASSRRDRRCHGLHAACLNAAEGAVVVGAGEGQ